MVLDMDKYKYVKECLGQKIIRSSIRRMNTNDEEIIKVDSRVAAEKIEERKEELSLDRT